MRNEFPGYFRLSPSKLEGMWQNGIFSFDANFLLNAYRYSNETREQVFTTLDAIKERIWISHQAAAEFLKNRLDAITEAEKSYDDVQKPIKEIESILHKSRHPYVDDSLLEEFKQVSKKMCENLDKRKAEFVKLWTEDPIEQRLADLCEGRIGPSMNEVESKQAVVDGKKRYDSKIPPGYMDGDKPEDTRYGDYILWEQLIRHSEKVKKPVIFVTGDGKEDWIWTHKGKTVGPRPELIAEFVARAKVEFWLYSPERFLELSKTYLKQKVSSEAIEEVKSMRKSDPPLESDDSFPVIKALTSEQINLLKQALDNAEVKHLFLSGEVSLANFLKAYAGAKAPAEFLQLFQEHGSSQAFKDWINYYSD